MMNVPNIGVVLNWRNEINKSNMYSLHIRIKQFNTARYFKIPLPLKIRKDQWSGKENSWIKDHHPFAYEINTKIIEIKASIHEYIKRMMYFDKPVTVDGIIAHLTKKGDGKSFFDFMQHYIMRPPEKLELNTVKKYMTTLGHLRKFKKTILFTEIDNALLLDFSRFLQVDLGIGGAATKKYIEAFKKVIRQARRENYISPQQMEFLFDGLNVWV